MAVRSKAYPAFTLQYCMRLVESIYGRYGQSTYITREDVAKASGKNVNYIQMPVSSAGQYGILEMKPKMGYKPTELFVRAFKPLSEDERRSALIQCFKGPKLYTDVIAEVGTGKFPTVEGLETILFRKHGISQGAAKTAAEVFYENLNDLKLLGADGVVLLNGTPSAAADANDDDLPPQDEVVSTAPMLIERRKQAPESVVMDSEFRKIEVPLTDRKKAVLMVPDNLTQRDVDIIKAQLSVIELSL